MTKIAIIGAGIGGLTTAIAIKKYRPDLEVEVYESSPRLHAVGAGLGLGANAIISFEELGIKEAVLKVSNVLERFRILDKQGRTITETNNFTINKDLNTISNFAIHRADLQQVLQQQAGNTAIQLNKRVLSFEQTTDKVILCFADDSNAVVDYVVAADGIHSLFRRQLLPQSEVRYAGYTCWRGVTDKWPEGFKQTLATETWAGGKRFGIVPVAGKRIYWFACINSAVPKNPVFAQYTKEDLLQSFSGFHFPVAEIIRLTDSSKIIWNDIIDLKPIPQFAFGRILLLGDAAHATTPNMGQGACQAIEGATILGKTIAKATDIQEAFRLFGQKRLKRTAFIVNRSWQIGKVAHWSNPFLCALRNLAFRMVPKSAAEKQVQQILEVDFR
jgi:2-polyprenyl-6-methoxyphenol hydroxylase-like FAD-dependent oxidoreductase